MYINISEFIQNENELIYKDSRTCDISGAFPDQDFSGTASFDVLISKVDNKELILDLDIDYTYTKPCDRCLKKVENTENTKYQAKLSNTEYKDDYDEIEDIDVVSLYQNEFDVCKLINDVIVVSIPMKTLCEESCAGLCPKCGKDLNKGECNCDTDVIDERFSVLKDFKIDEEV